MTRPTDEKLRERAKARIIEWLNKPSVSLLLDGPEMMAAFAAEEVEKALKERPIVLGDLVWLPNPPQEYLRNRIGTVIRIGRLGDGVVEAEFGVVAMGGAGGTLSEPEVVHQAHVSHFRLVGSPAIEAALARVTAEAQTAREERDALLPLAKARLDDLHGFAAASGYWRQGGHTNPQQTCPHPDCAHVRALAHGADHA